MKKQVLDPVAILAGVRTPFIKSFTTFNNVKAVDLGTAMLQEVVRRGGISPTDIDEVIIGNVAGPPDAANIARVIALRAGIPHDRIAHTVNRNCASGMESILNGWHAIHVDRSDLVIAGGTESMSDIPLLFRRSAKSIWQRLAQAKTMGQKLSAIASLRFRHLKPVFGIKLGLADPVCGLNMGQTAEILARDFDISREEQDQFAMHSHHKAEAARKRCFLSGEIHPFDPDPETHVVEDNTIRMSQSMEQLAKLRPVFSTDGTVTAGNSCSLADGAAGLLIGGVNSREYADKRPIGYITACAIAGCDPRRMGLGPVYAVSKLLNDTGLTLGDFDLIEINEAFAAQVLACQRAMASKTFAQQELGRSEALGEIDPTRLNINGGAIALGHPVGSTGTRLILTLARALKENGKRRGLATLCVGGGQGMAMIVETELEDQS